MWLEGELDAMTTQISRIRLFIGSGATVARSMGTDFSGQRKGVVASSAFAEYRGSVDSSSEPRGFHIASRSHRYFAHFRHDRARCLRSVRVTLGVPLECHSEFPTQRG